MSDLKEALRHIDPRTVTYDEWLSVGMALKEEGYDCSDWDEWSRNDSRYKDGDCEKRWHGFNRHDVKGGTIVHMARERGWNDSRVHEDYALGWDSMIANDYVPIDMAKAKYVEMPKVPAFDGSSWGSQLRQYVELLFHPDEYIGYCTGDVFEDTKRHKWLPTKGDWVLCSELLERLDRYNGDPGFTVGDYKQEAGAWIRFNPLDGNGAKNENVTAFRYALVESDSLSLEEQWEKINAMELPCRVVVNSGGKSLHAIVHIGAYDAQEYAQRVNFLYTICEKNGMKIDRANRNPSRLSRMPGVTRNGKPQYIMAENIGCKDFKEWKEHIEENAADDLPDFEDLGELMRNPPPMAEELIEGILRKGHKMMIASKSKAGKSFLLMQLAAAIAEGKEWLGRPCKQGNVVYVNMEIDRASFVNRFNNIYAASGFPKTNTDKGSVQVWTLRGHVLTLPQLAPKLVRKMKNMDISAVILDPMYKVMEGDENSAGDMAKICNQFDYICNEAGCSFIYCHHHSKGAQGGKDSIDRASGSGVFARDPDAILDLTEIAVPDVKRDQNRRFAREEAMASGKNPDEAERRADAMTAWRLTTTLREFMNLQPLSLWFKYPLHVIDPSLDDYELRGSETKSALGAEVRSVQAKSQMANNIERVISFLTFNTGKNYTVKMLSDELDTPDRTLRDWIRASDGLLYIENSFVKIQERGGD